MIRHALCACLLLMMTRTGSAQLPFPFPQHTGLLSTLLEPPHVMEVLEVSGGNGSFSIKASIEGRGTVTHSQTNSRPTRDSTFVAGLRAGRRYRLPQCVIDILGSDEAARLVHSMLGKAFGELRQERPFLAKVLDQGLGGSTYSIILQEAGGRLWHLGGFFPDDDARTIAAHLVKGRSFEFPSVLDDALRTPEQRAEQMKPKSDAARALQHYLGEWRGTLDDNPSARVEMICLPRPNGSGIWRTITFHLPADDLPPLPDVAVMEYDPSEHVYLAGSMADGSPPPLRSTWDERKRTFTTVLPANDRGLRRVNTATFTREDRIDWKTETQSQKGEILATNSGHYDRVRAYESDTQEPPKPVRLADGPAPPASVDSSGVPVIKSGDPFVLTYEGALDALTSAPAFRATVLSVTVTPDEATIQFRPTSGSTQTISNRVSAIGTSDIAKALKQLKQDQVYEFPYCLTHPGQKEAGAPATPQMKALENFIGTWRVHRRTRQNEPEIEPYTIRYFWSADGTGIWRELTRDRTTTLELMRFDPGAGFYVWAREHSAANPKEFQATWDAGTRTMKLARLFPNAPPGPVREEVTRRFTSDDLVEWESHYVKADGTKTNEHSGTYERIKE